MEKLQFELTNEQRKYFGLIPVDKEWELVKLFNSYVYFHGDLIKKEILVKDNSYLERELNEKTSENRTVLLPKTSKGKPKKLNLTATYSFSPFGTYFSFSSESGYISIANYTTQTTYFSKENNEVKNFDGLRNWINNWIAETTEEDLQEIEAFKSAKREKCKFKEGDFFTFKIDRRKWGFGRILIDVAKLQKSEAFQKQKNYGLSNFMGKALIVKIYHKISNSPNTDLEELSKCLSMPSQSIMDNQFFYGESKIIGHKELDMNEYDMLISFGRSINSKDKDTVYLQYGLIYKETSVSKFNKYLVAKEKNTNGYHNENPYRYESIGFSLNIDALEDCMKESANTPYWNSEYYEVKTDLRNPKNTEIKREIFKYFKLDPDKSYEANLKISQHFRSSS